MELALAWLEATGPALALRTSTVAYPLVNAAHIVGISLLVGTVLLLDWHILAARQPGAYRRASAVLRPGALVGLVLAAASGSVLFATRASEYAFNPALQLKLALLLLALGNVAVFGRASQLVARNAPPSTLMRACACASLLLWLAVVGAGRWIAFMN
jgi:hypothetical protein